MSRELIQTTKEVWYKEIRHKTANIVVGEQDGIAF
jgi:hypothetical protein